MCGRFFAIGQCWQLSALIDRSVLHQHLWRFIRDKLNHALNRYFLVFIVSDKRSPHVGNAGCKPEIVDEESEITYSKGFVCHCLSSHQQNHADAKRDSIVADGGDQVAENFGLDHRLATHTVESTQMPNDLRFCIGNLHSLDRSKK